MTLLSGNACETLNLLQFNHNMLVNSVSTSEELTEQFIVKQYADIFEGLGHIGDYHIEVDESVSPVQNHSRRVPVPLQKELCDKLSKMEQDGIIAKVSTPTPWISNMVAVKTPNKLRVCIDPQDLNKAILRPHYPTKTIEDIAPMLVSARVFSVVDAKDGFLQIKLDNASSFRTTFWTPQGRYRWLRMPFGISSAPEEFSRQLSEVLEGLANIEVIADDILIYGCGETYEDAVKDHDSAFVKLLDRAKERNLKLNKCKLKFKLQSVRYMGHVLSDKGLCVDPEKVKAITDMPRPTNVTDVQRLIGFVNYLSKFLAHLSETCEPLRRLCDKERPFEWMPQHEEAFETIKSQVSSTPVLKFYDINKPVVIECDASSVGLGAVLLQAGQPVSYASRALSKTEQNYCQLEKECLAICFAMEKFDNYVLGKSVSVLSDHKPLETIFKKSILSSPKRLQRMRLRLQKYTFTVQY